MNAEEEIRAELARLAKRSAALTVALAALTGTGAAKRWEKQGRPSTEALLSDEWEPMREFVSRLVFHRFDRTMVYTLLRSGAAEKGPETGDIRRRVAA